MTATVINEAPTVYPQALLSTFLTPGEYADGAGSVPADAPSGVTPGWHLIVENPEGSYLFKQTLVSTPPADATRTPPIPEASIYVRYYVAGANGAANGEFNPWTSWQLVPA